MHTLTSGNHIRFYKSVHSDKFIQLPYKSKSWASNAVMQL
jgi:hypothetical protein